MTLSRTASTRDKILAAGLKLFSGKGFLATTTRELAEEANIAEVTLFRHFASKEKLFEKVIETFSIIPDIEELLPQLRTLPFEKGLTLLAESLLDGLTARKNWIVLMHGEVRRNPDRLLKVYHSFLDRILDDIAQYFREQQAMGAMGDLDPELAARAFYGMIFSFFNTEEVLLRKNYRATGRSQAICTFTRLLMDGIRARAGDPSAVVQYKPCERGDAHQFNSLAALLPSSV